MTSGGAPKRATVPGPTVRIGASPKVRSAPVRYMICDRSGNKQFAGSGGPIPSRGLQNTRQPRGRLQGRSYRRRDDNPHRSICERAEKISQWTWWGQRHAGPNGFERKTSTRGRNALPVVRGFSRVKSHTEGGKGGALVERKSRGPFAPRANTGR